MKTMTCKQLGGACEQPFYAESFEEIAAMSQQHGKDMFAIKDSAHLKAMQDMKQLLKSPDEMKEWFEGKRKEFNALPDT